MTSEHLSLKRAEDFYDPNLRAKRFMDEVLIPYLEQRKDNLKSVTLKELVALISGYNLGFGWSISPVYLSSAVREKIKSLEESTIDHQPPITVLIHARRLTQELLEFPTEILTPKFPPDEKP